MSVEMDKVTQALDVLKTSAGEPDREKREEIARTALEVSEDCIEAWLLLAHEAVTDLPKVKEYLQNAVAAGDRLFADRKEEWEGKYWVVAQTRPYMQARAGLGQVLWELGEKEEAIVVLQDTLALNPADHQNVRLVLLKALLMEKRYEAAQELVARYEDEQSTVMVYAKLLTAYALYSDSLLARSAFLAAKRQNPYVLDYLLGLRVLPQKLPKQVKPGEESEAIRYAAVFIDTWEQTEGAVQYLRKQKKLRADRDTRKKG